MNDEQEIRKETDFWGNKKEVIYEDGKKIGEIRIEERGGFFGIGGESTKVEYDNSGNEVSYTTKEERGGILGIGAREISVKRDVNGHEKSTLEVEKRGGFCGVGSHHILAERDTSGNLVSESNHERRGDILGFGGERVRVVRQQEKVLLNNVHRDEGDAQSLDYYDTNIDSSTSKLKYNSIPISNKTRSQKSLDITGLHIFFVFIILYFLYSFSSPYFGKYPIDYDYKHSYGFAEKIISTKYNNHILLGEGDFMAVRGKPKNGSTPLAVHRWTNNPRPYTVISLNERGGATWVRNDFYDGYIADIASNKNGDIVIVGDGRKHDKESFISVRKYNSAKQEIFHKKYFFKYSKDNFHWAEKVVSTGSGFAIYAKVKKNKKYYNSIINFDKNGNKLWQRLYHGREYNRPYTGTILIRNNNMYMISAFRYKGSIFVGHKGLPAFLSIVKLNMKGDEIWSKEYKYDFNIKQVLNSKYNIKIIGNSSNDIYALTIATNGGLIEGKKLYVKDSCDIESVILTSKNNYLAVGRIGTFNYDGCIVELNQYGKEIWTQSYGQSKNFYNIYGENGGYIITGVADKWFWEDDKKNWSVMKIKNDKEKVSSLKYNNQTRQNDFVTSPKNSTNSKQITSKNYTNTLMYKKTHLKKGKYRVTNIKNGSYLNVRSGSGTRYRIITRLKYNAKGIMVLYCVGGWCKIKNTNGSYIGWVSKKYLQKEGSVNKKVTKPKKVYSSQKAVRNARPSFYAPKQKKVKQLKYKIFSIKSPKLVKGMHFVKVKIGGKKKEFNLFCPTNSITDITKKPYVERYIDLESKLPYPDSQMIVNMFKKICKKKVRVETLDELLK